MTGGQSELLSRFSAEEDRGLGLCTGCPRLCRWACPVAEAEARETSSPWNLVVASDLVKRGRASIDAIGEVFYRCSSCGACEAACLHENDVPRWLTLARARALGAHAAPAKVLEVRGRFGVAGNPYGVGLESALLDLVRPITGDDRLAPSGSTVYLPGCSTIQSFPSAVTGFLRALAVRGLGEVSVTAASAGCCGLPLLWAGDLAGFRAHATRFVELLGPARRLVVHDPACAHALKVRYPEFGVEVRAEVTTVVEHLAEHLDLAKGADPAPNGPADLAYADSCQLSRGLGLAELPRRLIQRATGRRPIELPGLGPGGFDCCGAGGLLPESAPATALEMANVRIEAFQSSGASRLVVASPRCAAHLTAARPELPVIDLTALFAELSP